MTNDELANLDATAQAELVRSGTISPTELVQAAIDRLDAVNPKINSTTSTRYEKALSEAAEPDLPSGPFRGVPFLVKDLWTHMAGERMLNGVKALSAIDYRPTFSTTVVERYRAAGLVIIGRTTTPELGLVACTEADSSGITRNPWNLEYTPGGSSGGSAAAVAAGAVPFAHASDGGGSIRLPAGCCGLVGLKPSQGRMTAGPVRAENNLSVEHCVSRSVRDTAALLDATAGPGMGDAVIAPPQRRPYTAELTSPAGPLRIGFMAHSPRGPLDDELSAAVRTTASWLEALGHVVEDAYPKPMDSLPELSKVFTAVWCVNTSQSLKTVASLLGREVGPDDVEPYTWQLASIARKLTADQYAESLGAMISFRREMGTWWGPKGDNGAGFDLLLTPTHGSLTPLIGALKAAPDHPERGQANGIFSTFTSPLNVTGQPAISLPLHTDSRGMPLGIQLVAGYGREDLLIGVASQLEAAHPWAGRRPAVYA